MKNSSKVSFLTPINNGIGNFSASFSPQIRNTMSVKNSNVTQLNPKFTV